MMAAGGLRVAVLGLNYAPEPTGIAPYTSRIAAGLQERGHTVRVVTTFPHYPEWRVLPGYEGWTRHEDSEGVAVTRVRHYVPRRPTSGRRALSEMAFGGRLVTLGWHQPEVVVCPSPALLSTAAVAVRASLGETRPAFGVIVQDLYSVGVGETQAGGGGSVAALKRLESWVLRKADGVSVIHDRFKRRVIGSLGVAEHKVDVIRNWTHVPSPVAFDRRCFRRRLRWGDETVVLHAGAMGDKQGLSNVVCAARLAEAESAPLRFVLLGNGKHRTALERQAAGCSSIEFIDPLPGDEYVRAMRAADVLLVNERPGLLEMAVPSKLTSYFSTGVPVLAATEEGSTTSEELAASGAGVRVAPGEPAALVAAALRLRHDPTRAAEIGAQGPAYCESLLSEDVALDAYDAWVRKLYSRRHGGHA